MKRQNKAIERNTLTTVTKENNDQVTAEIMMKMNCITATNKLQLEVKIKYN